ncbi:hypothetical protein CDAR_591791 [Caerostris darwini]|uniref:Uncharacterized protein n=1 Tax=Caerostris darwini TaxID=1538125 RepID=A0AAV4PLU9_9ARAC|nr:hypothetical protein CDAR_591791 [Caerostris darwini]
MDLSSDLSTSGNTKNETMWQLIAYPKRLISLNDSFVFLFPSKKIIKGRTAERRDATSFSFQQITDFTIFLRIPSAHYYYTEATLPSAEEKENKNVSFDCSAVRGAGGPASCSLLQKLTQTFYLSHNLNAFNWKARFVFWNFNS